MKLNIDKTSYTESKINTHLFTKAIRHSNTFKSGFTIVEVSILFVIFLIVAFLVAPLSLDDTLKEKYASKWRNVQSDFDNIFISVNARKEDDNFNFTPVFESVINPELKDEQDLYKITYMNGTFPSSTYRFTNYKKTYSNATLAYKLYNSPQQGAIGMLMYDVNGSEGPNVWGKDVFGYNIFSDRFEPFCKNDSLAVQKKECSKTGTGLCCSNYYLIGGTFN